MERNVAPLPCGMEKRTRLFLESNIDVDVTTRPRSDENCTSGPRHRNCTLTLENSCCQKSSHMLCDDTSTEVAGTYRSFARVLLHAHVLVVVSTLCGHSQGSGGSSLQARACSRVIILVAWIMGTHSPHLLPASIIEPPEFALSTLLFVRETFSPSRLLLPSTGWPK